MRPDVSVPLTGRSTARVRPIESADVVPVAEFLGKRLHGDGGAARYRRILEYTWSSERPNYGFLIEDAGQVRGVQGAIYSRRCIAGADYRFCNMTSWCVDEPYRWASLGLLRALLAQPDYTFTNFSATPAVATILERLGFQRLDSGKLLFPIGLAGRPPRGVRLLHRPDDVRAALASDDRAIFDDHARYRCGQLAIVAGDQYCHLVTVKRGRRGVYFADVLYASHPRLLAENVGALFWPLFRRHRTLVVGIDARWVHAPPRLALWFARPSFFRGAGVSPDRVASIYSEIVAMYG
jgi:hypothetical protein